MLGMAEKCHFGRRKHKRERIISRKSVYIEGRNGRLPISLEKFGIELHLPRFCGESGYLLAVCDGVFSVLGLQWPPDALGLCSKF